MGNNSSPGFISLIGRVARTGYGAMQNRFELFAVEWQEEKARITETLIWAILLLFLVMLTVVMLTGTLIFLFPEDLRIYAAGGFTLLYFIGAVAAFFVFKGLIKREPFAETINEAKKDKEWLESFK
jgi:uncharacterized membrane protein YqjE